MSSVHAATLTRAAEMLGSTEALAEYLRVAADRLALWQEGVVAPPNDVFLRAVDLVLTHQLAQMRLLHEARPHQD